MSGGAKVVLSGAVAAGLALTACGPAGTGSSDSGDYGSQPVSVAAAVRYARTHPVPHRGNEFAGVITRWTDTSTDQFYAWEVQVALPSGLAVTVYCGDPVSTAKECTWRGPGQPGDYMYFPSDDNAAQPGGVRMIKAGAAR